MVTPNQTLTEQTLSDETVESSFQKISTTIHKEDLRKIEMLASYERTSKSALLRDIVGQYLKDIDFTEIEKLYKPEKYDKTDRLVVQIPKAMMRRLNKLSTGAGVKRAQLVREFLEGAIASIK